MDRPIFEVFAAVPENIGRKVGTKVFVSALYASIFSSEVRPRLHLIFSEIIQCCKRIKNTRVFDFLGLELE